MVDSERVLVVAPLGRDAAIVEGLLRGDYAIEVVANPADLPGAIREGAALAIVTEEALTGPVVADLTMALGAQEAWSDFPMIIFNAPASRRLASSLETWKPLGNVTVLDRPVRGNILRSAVAAAFRSRKRQYQARQAIATRDQFLAMLGHELRNPLAAIALATQTMIRRQEGADPAQKLNVIHNQALQLSRLVDDLLDVARVTTGKVVLQPMPIDLIEVINRSVNAMRELVENNGITLGWNPPTDRIFVAADPARIDQVLTNLINNASKYTQAGGRIDVAVDVKGSHVSVHVRDTGIGIEPAMLGGIFELFTQVDSSLDRARGGLGIGLTVVKHLIELHGGTVRASSDGRGTGSEFVVTLPTIEEAPRSQRDLPCFAPTDQKSIVVVEDNKDIRESLEELLSDLGHAVKTATDGQAGADLIVSTQPDLALVDIGLPKLNGYQVAEKVRALVGDRVYLIALTGYGQPEDKRRALAAGFHTHLTKPVYLADIERTIHQRPSA